ncbi:MAG: substrate-binding and VWA domain-containing protein [Nocardioides sp.]
MLLPLVAGLISYVVYGDDAEAACQDGTTSLVIASSLDKAPLLQVLADDYTSDTASSARACTDITIVPKASGAAESALAAGWQESDGPRPDVWSPTSSIWLPILEANLLERQASSLVLAPDPKQSIASSPQVVAMPRPMAKALGWPQTDIGWRDLLGLALDDAGWGRYGHPEWGRFSLGKSNPTIAQPGLDATIATYYAGAGSESKIKTSGLTLDDISSAKTRRFVAGVEQSILRYGDSSLQFLTNWQQADRQGQSLTYLSALVTQENLITSYNEGNPTADPTKKEAEEKPTVPLVAVYPKEGTSYTDHPYAILSAPWVDDATRSLAGDFLKYLRSPDVQRRWQDNGFRNYQRESGPGATEAIGILPDQPATVLQNPPPEIVSAILESWSELRKTANVLSLVDVSGSMAETLPGSSVTKLAAAKDAATKSLELFTDRDEVGLWSFSSDSQDRPTYDELVSIAPMRSTKDGRRHRDRLTSAVGALEGTGGTGLYDAIDAAYREVVSGDDDKRIDAVVVLTDGKNDVRGGVGLDQLLKLLRTGVDGRTARVITIAYGPDADSEVLAKIATASKGATYLAPSDEELAKVYASALSNF